MIFSRSKGKGESAQSALRTVESATIKRWQDIAARATSDKKETYTVDAEEERYIVDWETASGAINLTAAITEEQPVVEAKPLPCRQETPPSPSPVTRSLLPTDFTLPIEEDLKRRFGNIKSALGPGTVIEGTFKFDSPVCVEGTLKGEVSSTSVLIVGDRAVVEAEVKVGSLIILGEVTGDIEANELIEIRAGGRLTGDILSRRLVIEEGGRFNGTCNTLD